jgi:hypothetical protein
MYGMLVSTVPLDCKEVEDVFDIIIRRETVYAVLCRVWCLFLWGHVGESGTVARFDVRATPSTMAAKHPNEFGIHPRNTQYKNDTPVAFSTHLALPAIAMSLPSPSDDSHSCDTLPPARLSSPAPTVSSDHWSSHLPSPSYPPLDLRPSVLSQPGHRKLCVRHQRIADEGTNLKLQQVRPPLSFRPLHPISYYVSWCPLISCLTRDFFRYVLGPR